MQNLQLEATNETGRRYNFWFIMRFKQDEPCDGALLMVSNKVSFI